ncbi:MAG: C40 family peptidase, partial [Sulfurovaceae bacterium]|nr:C40 family peptidase [Sulfurovaceae bacterium]
MRKIKGISLAWIIIPFLTSGCMQEKVSTITPKKSTNKIALNSNEQNNSLLQKQNNPILTLSTNTIDDNISSTETIEQDNTLYELATIIQDNNDINNEIIDTDEDISQSTNDISNNWTEYTKEDEVIDTAKGFLGTKYVWAANGPNCFDCSGFTKYVYKQNGITLPRYSGHQAKVGTKVSFNELEKGDLVFFDTEHKFRGKVNHVGIYIGDGKFIHASSAKKKVIITSFDKKPFYKRR